MKFFKVCLLVFIMLLHGGFSFANDRSFNKEVIVLAKNTLFEYVKYGRENRSYGALGAQISNGVFVTLTKDGIVRGCMGTVFPKCASLGEEISKNTILAASMDIRYPKITADELPYIKYQISFVKNIKSVGANGVRPLSAAPLHNPAKFGLLVASGKRGGVLLPGEAKTAEWQVRECRRKAGIKPGEPAQMYVFETEVIKN